MAGSNNESGSKERRDIADTIEEEMRIWVCGGWTLHEIGGEIVEKIRQSVSITIKSQETSREKW